MKRVAIIFFVFLTICGIVLFVLYYHNVEFRLQSALMIIIGFTGTIYFCKSFLKEYTSVPLVFNITYDLPLPQRLTDSMFNRRRNLQSKIDSSQTITSEYNILKTIRAFAETNPDEYLFDVAMTLNNLGNLNRNIYSYPEAEASYKEAIEIFRTLVEKQPDEYLPALGTILNNLGNLQFHYIYGEKKAVECYDEALKIFRTLVEKEPDEYLSALGTISFNISKCFLPDLKLALKYAEESLKVLQKSKRTPMVRTILYSTKKLIDICGYENRK